MLLAALIWGATFVVQQVGTGGLQAITFTGARMVLGACFVLPLAVRQWRRLNRGNATLSAQHWLGIVLTGMVLFTAAALQQYGIFHTTVTNAGFLTALYVPLVPLISYFLLRRWVHWSAWPASCFCLVGTYIMTGAEPIEIRTGDFWVISSSLFWAVHVILVGTMAVRTKAPLVVACGQFFAGGLSAMILGMLIERPALVDFQSAWFGILWAGLLSTGIGFTLQVLGQRFTHEADAAIILSSETVFAAIAGFIFLGERMNSSELSGAIMIFLGMITVQLYPLLRKHARDPAAPL